MSSPAEFLAGVFLSIMVPITSTKNVKAKPAADNTHVMVWLLRGGSGSGGGGGVKSSSTYDFSNVAWSYVVISEQRLAKTFECPRE